MKSFYHFVCMMLLLFPVLTKAQAYAGTGCKNQHNTTLKAAFQSGILPPANGLAYSFYEHWSSSYLKVPIKPQKPVAQLDPEEEERIAIEDDRDSCRFTVLSLIDDNPKTAWCEGVEGEGVGEVAMVMSAFKSNFKIKNGFGKSNETYSKNGRIKKMRATVFSSGPFSRPLGSSETNNVPELKKVFSQEVTLQDTSDWQNVELPNFELTNSVFYTLGFEILEIYPGAKYQDTCVSEIAFE